MMLLILKMSFLLSLKNMRYFAHTLNLIIQTVLILETNLIEKNYCKSLKKNIEAYNKLKTYQINIAIKNPKK